MVYGIFGGLIIAFILALFGFDDMVIEVAQDFSPIKLTSSHYYVAAALIGVLCEIVQDITLRIRVWYGRR